MKKVIVFGASGYLGGSLCTSLAKHYYVYAISRSPLSLAGVSTIVVDSFSAERLDNLLAQIRPDCVVSCLGLAHKSKAPYEQFLQINSVINERIFRVCQSLSVSQFIYISSASVYVDLVNLSMLPLPVFSEDMRLQASQSYGRSKVVAENNLLRILSASSTKLLILRPPAIYGNGCPGSFSLLRKLIYHQIPLPILPTDSSRSFLSISNFARYIHFFIDSCHSGTFNIADPDLLTLKETFHLVADSMAKPLRFLPYRKLLSLLGFESKLFRLTTSFVLDTSSANQLLPSNMLCPSDLAIINSFSRDKQ